MLNNNFYKTLAVALANKNLPSAMINTDGLVKDINSGTNIPQYLFDAIYTSAVLTTKNSRGMVFGTGSTPPEMDDYWLSGEFITTLSGIAHQLTVDTSNGAISITKKVTVQNNGTASVTVNEMGLLASNGSNYEMIDRVVFDSPLTLAPGEQGVITYTLNMPIPQ